MEYTRLVEVSNLLDDHYKMRDFSKMTDFIQNAISVSFVDGMSLRLVECKVDKFLNTDMFLNWVRKTYPLYKEYMNDQTLLQIQ